MSRFPARSEQSLMAQPEESQAGIFKSPSIEPSRTECDRLARLTGLLDVEFIAADGDYLYWEDDWGHPRRTLDLAGGAGG
jgi:hypothetical protein